MDIRADEITKIIRDQLGGYSAGIDVSETGSVLSVGDGIARIHGLEKCMAGELLELPHGVTGMALNLEEDSVGAVLMGEASKISEGDQVKRTRSHQVRAGRRRAGRPCGRRARSTPSTARAPSRPTASRETSSVKAPGIIKRKSVQRAAADRHQSRSTR